MSAHRVLEIAVAGPGAAAVALANGADRVELCTALELGGLTPSQAAIEAAVATGIPVHVLIRCRPGDFVYGPDELELMAGEARTALRSGAAGVVIGALTEQGELDRRALHRLVGAALETQPAATVVFHRAVDVVSDPVALVDELAGTGVGEVLSSGGCPRALDGLETLTRMAEVGGTVGVGIVVGGGVEPGQIAALLTADVTGIHLSAKSAVFRRAPAAVPLGVADLPDAPDHFVTSADVVAAARRALDSSDRNTESI